MTTPLLRAAIAISSAIPASLEWERVKRTMFSIPDETLGEFEKRYAPAKIAHRDALRDRRGASNAKLVDAADRIAHRVTFPATRIEADREREAKRDAAFREEYRPALEMHVVALKANAANGRHEQDRRLCLALCEAVLSDEGCGGFEFMIACHAAHDVTREALEAKSDAKGRQRVEAERKKAS